MIMMPIVLISFACMLSSCLYPEANSHSNNVSYRESIQRIQSAVDDYQKEVGLLPILNADTSTPRYEKFRIDLDLLRKKGYIDEIPSTAFEMGGSVYFLLLNEETDPEVKVMDLITVQKVNDIQLKVQRYKAAHQGGLPSGDELYPGLFSIDSRKAGGISGELESIYSGQSIPYLVDKSGNVYVDYAFDIMAAIDKNEVVPEEGTDLRIQLEQASYFVPVKSLPYHWINSQPVPQAPN
ncbi:hypothetical protein [Paenibacillus sp. sgz500958]|uniref:hypothetical protein n=1 Tax=Paenibacillus sp. sgz500958 TaxID=3242475 RepID=UPI0036D2F40E